MKWHLYTLITLCLFWVGTCGPIPVRKTYLDTNIKVEEVRSNDSRIGMKTSIGYFLSDTNVDKLDNKKHPPCWGDTSTPAYIFRHSSRDSFESLSSPVRYLKESPSGVSYDMSHMDNRVDKPKGVDIQKFPTDSSSSEMLALSSPHFYSKNFGANFLFYTPSNPIGYTLFLLPDAECTCTKWEVELLILKHAMRGVH